MTDLLLCSLYVGLWAASLVVLLRAMPLVQRLVREGKKPWACDVCMSFWCTLGVVTVAALRGVPASECSWSTAPVFACFVFDGQTLRAALPGFAIALLTLRKLTEPLRLPPNLSELSEEE